MSRKLNDAEFKHNKIIDDLMAIIDCAEEFDFNKIELTSFLLSDDRRRQQIRIRLINLLKKRSNGQSCWRIDDCGRVANGLRTRLDFYFLKFTIPNGTAKNHFVRDGKNTAGRLEIVCV